MADAKKQDPITPAGDPEVKPHTKVAATSTKDGIVKPAGDPEVKPK
jgi:hypothetical protein